MKLSVVIPAYNAEKIIGLTLESVHDYLSKQPYDWEILVVNDGSKDKTVEVVENLKAQIPNLRLIDNKENQGKGWVVRQGMMEARGDWRLFMDDDNSTTIDHLDRFWPEIERGNDIVIASIAVKGARVAKVEKFYRRLLGKLGNLWIQFWVLPGIWDTQRGFKLFSAKSAMMIFPKLTIKRWGFDVEVLALARKLGFKIKEVPIDWRNEGMSRVKPAAYLQVLWEVLKIRWNLWVNSYKL
jgi:glycosyltransferase involved in cell wall biosynthesis